MTVPNVLAVHVKRSPGAQHPVAVEEQFDLPGMPSMYLMGIVFHNGQRLNSGHSTCLCRGPGGRFWYFNDHFPVHRVDSEVAHLMPRDVYMV